MNLELSALNKTWIFDLDGTIVKHNGYLDGEDILLPGVKEFFNNIPESDYILILSARRNAFREQTETFLRKSGIRYNDILFEFPVGERILINDVKPSGLKTAFSVNVPRNSGLDIDVTINENL